MKMLSLRANQPSFHPVIFKDGINIIVGKQLTVIPIMALESLCCSILYIFAWVRIKLTLLQQNCQIGNLPLNLKSMGKNMIQQDVQLNKIK